MHLKIWKPLWHFLLNITIVNSYKLHRDTSKSHQSQREFRIRLVIQLFENSKRLYEKPSAVKSSLFLRVYSISKREYGKLERIRDKAKYYVLCLYAGRKVSNSAKMRKPLRELSINSIISRQLDKGKRRERASRGIYGCKLCGIHICNHIACWKEHINAIPRV